MLGRRARSVLGVDERGWGFGDGTETPSHALTPFTQSASQAASHSLGQTKRRSILQEDSTLPGGWGIIPLHHVGGVGGGRNTRVRGLCLRSRAPLHIHTHKYI